MTAASEPPHDRADAMIRQQLSIVDNLRDLLMDAVPDLAAGLDFAQTEALPLEHFLPDWRRRESDLIFRIPYRDSAGAVPVLILVLVEHQSRPDPRMPLRLLLYTVFCWDREWFAWENLPPPRPPLRLSPVLPLVFHTGPRPWGSARTLADLLPHCPDLLRPLLPAWQPLFWDLAVRDPEGLLALAGPWLQALAVLRADQADSATFQRVLEEALGRVAAVAETSEPRWRELVRFILTWALDHRGPEERDGLLAAAVAPYSGGERRESVETMGRTIADALRDEGRVEGRREALRQTLRRVMEKRYGLLPAEVVQRINALADVQQMQDYMEQVIDVERLEAFSW